MRTDEMSDGFEAFIRAARGRIEGVGARQYDRGSIQRFEQLSLTTLADELLEELQDVAVWTYEIAERVQRIRFALRERDLDTPVPAHEEVAAYIANPHAGRP